MQQQASRPPQKLDDLPLISVIIRSMDRSTLSEALDSVALQTYPNIEVVVVNAKGAGHSLLGDWCGHFPLRLVLADDGRALIRPQAANLGLEKAKGQWLIFLDDDDLFDPDHIADLIQALHVHPQVKAAYIGVRVEDEKGHIRTLFNSPYDQRKLFISNFIPIHALLFSRALIDKNGARFDENMEVYEDWDFWLQLSYRTSFLHINKISAVYRVALGDSGLGLNVNKNLQLQGREFLYDKWRLIWTGKDINCITQYLFEQLAKLNHDLDEVGAQLTYSNQVVVQRDEQLSVLNQELATVGKELAYSYHEALLLKEKIDKLNQTIELRDITIHKIINSKSWFCTKPIRWTGRVIRGEITNVMDPFKRSLPIKKLNENKKQLTSKHKSPVAVILPVYRGVEMTKRCILAAMPGILAVPGARIIAINDASPDKGMQEMLEQLAGQWPNIFVVLFNEKNLGFVGTVNRGFTYFPEYDAVLLNSDVIVPKDWLSRLVDEAYSRTNVATVTPFSNNATICSFPYFLQENVQPFNLDVNAIDAVFRHGKLPCIEAPTGVGFCMYIRRACLDEVGYLNEEKFGRGYGEENDLCQRALKNGWVNIISPNIYAFHEGGVSFSSDKHTLIDNAMKVLDEMHPNYHTDVQNFVKHDPVKTVRVTRFVQLLSVVNVPKVLHVSHAFGGGIGQHVNELAQYFEANIAHIILAPHGESGDVSISLGIGQAADKLIYNMPAEYSEMIDVLKAMGISTVHFHHSYGLDWKLLDLPKDLSVPHILTVHDFYWLNGNPTLTNELGKYPGFYSETLHNPLYPLPVGQTTADWQSRLRPLIENAAYVIFPSHSSKSFFKNIYGIDNAVVVPHLESTLTIDRRPGVFTKRTNYTIGVLGAIGKEKGADLLEQIAKETKKLGLNYRFKLIGYAHRALKSIKMTGPYKNKELVALIKQHELDVIFFPAQWPETYSYTLSYALDSALPIIAPNIGAFPERLSGRENTLLFNHLSPVNELVEQIEVFIENLTKDLSVTAPIYTGDASNPDFYSRDYISIVSQDLKTIDSNKLELFGLVSAHILNIAESNKSGWRESLLRTLWRLYIGRTTGWIGLVIPKKARTVIRKALSNSSIHDIAQPLKDK